MKAHLELQHDDGNTYTVDIELPQRPAEVSDYGPWFDAVAERFSTASHILIGPEHDAYLAFFKEAVADMANGDTAKAEKIATARG